MAGDDDDAEKLCLMPVLVKGNFFPTGLQRLSYTKVT